MICKICNKEFNQRSLPNHIHSMHHLKAKEYYDLYIEPNTQHLCKFCGKETKFKSIIYGYNKHCSIKCGAKDPEVQQKLINTNIEKYGIKFNCLNDKCRSNAFTKESNKKRKDSIKQTFDTKYGQHPMKLDVNKNKMKSTNQQKYGVDWVFQSDLVKDKIKQTSKSKYNVCWPSQSDKTKLTYKIHSLEKYGYSHYMNNPINRKMILNRVNKKEAENKCFELLKSKYKNIQRDYKSSAYPWKCDFYIEDIDTYIELHFFIVHGGHKFDPINDQSKLDKLKIKAQTSDFYKRYIDIWTKQDVLKYETAKQNNLNYLVFYNITDFNNYFVTH